MYTPKTYDDIKYETQYTSMYDVNALQTTGIWSTELPEDSAVWKDAGADLKWKAPKYGTDQTTNTDLQPHYKKCMSKFQHTMMEMCPKLEKLDVTLTWGTPYVASKKHGKKKSLSLEFDRRKPQEFTFASFRDEMMLRVAGHTGNCKTKLMNQAMGHCMKFLMSACRHDHTGSSHSMPKKIKDAGAYDLFADACYYLGMTKAQSTAYAIDATLTQPAKMLGLAANSNKGINMMELKSLGGVWHNAAQSRHKISISKVTNLQQVAYVCNKATKHDKLAAVVNNDYTQCSECVRTPKTQEEIQEKQQERQPPTEWTKYVTKLERDHADAIKTHKEDFTKKYPHHHQPNSSSHHAHAKVARG